MDRASIARTVARCKWRRSGRGISSAPWWEEYHPVVPWRAESAAVHLKENMMVLPIHQDIGDAEIARVAEEARRVFARGA